MLFCLLFRIRYSSSQYIHLLSTDQEFAVIWAVGISVAPKQAEAIQ